MTNNHWYENFNLGERVLFETFKSPRTNKNEVNIDTKMDKEYVDIVRHSRIP